MKKLILGSVVVCSVLLYLLSSNSINTKLFSFRYYTVLGLTAALALFLSGLVAYQVWRLRTKLKNKVFGSKLALRLVFLFTLVALLPGILVYSVSVQFLSKSIETWFDVRIENGLASGFKLGQESLDLSLNELTSKNRLLADRLSQQSSDQFQASLDALVGKQISQDLCIFSERGNILAFANIEHQPTPNIPDHEILKQALEKQSYQVIDSLANKELVLRSLVSFTSSSDPNSRYILQLTQPVPNTFEQDVNLVQSIYQDYQGLTSSRSNLKYLYAITLTLALLVVLLTTLSIAFFVSESISGSLEALAEGTRAVAQGDFTGQHPIQSSDELGALTGLFNQMTRQLLDAQQTSQQQRREIENAKSHLESVLSHLSSGVLALDSQHHLSSVNDSACQILDVPLSELRRMSLTDIASKHSLLSSFCSELELAIQANPRGEWQKQIERSGKNGMQILLLRGTHLARSSEAGYVVVFDDISHLLQAERQAAWGEVARRLAHEIKNPLTPIQLSAERLQHKLSKKLAAEDMELVDRATHTIVTQVQAMKNMVTDFADYAKASTAKLTDLDLHTLIREVLGLYEHNHFPITLKLDAVRSLIIGDSTRLRQVIHNLLQNAQDALVNVTEPKILLSTETHEHFILLRVEDNGEGFSKTTLSRAFEPYMTTKSKGTGLGLAIVKKIIEEHGGNIFIENIVQGGARININLPLKETHTNKTQ